MGLALRNLVCWVYLSEKGKSIFGHRIAKLVKRALNWSCWGRETSIHPVPPSLMPESAIDAQSLDKDHRSSEEHLKSSTKEFQPVSQLHQEPNLNVSMLTHIEWGINKRS